MHTAPSPKTVLITGATGTVGSGLARHFAAKGHTVVLAARDKQRLHALAEQIREAKAYPIDLANARSIEMLAMHLQADGIRPDVLINNAADVTSKPLLETSLEEIDHIIRVNVTGTLQLCQVLGREMAMRGSGAIVNISSLAGYKPNPNQTAYSISKGALNVASEALRAELKRYNIHVVNVALMGVGHGPAQVPVDQVAHRIERALHNREPEIFFYRRSKWLMRLYAAFPWLARRT
ncbi:MAG: SDR family NAD(P)-dependent oxidoreductase [Candidatus Hydrogenedentes bacterium]|nr:SDR family NAD(P)-dependent oxidoreductase [Candidatus Hydrogenedentota bacterium]